MISDTLPPRLGYARAVTCKWIIPAVPGYLVSLSWGQFNFAYDGTSPDYLEIFNSSAVALPKTLVSCLSSVTGIAPGCSMYCNATTSNGLCAPSCACVRGVRDRGKELIDCSRCSK
jgi:hypothetical protein